MAEARDTYTFGDSETAAARLELLAAMYQPATQALIGRWAPGRVDLAVDLGCGPGHTTRLLSEVTGAVSTIGIERSDDHRARAEAYASPGVTYLAHDVTVSPLPVPEADVILGRFLLTHLAEPLAALAVWAEALRPGGRLLVQETATLTSVDPALAAYYEAVAAVQLCHGQRLDIGAQLEQYQPPPGFTVVHSGRRSLTPAVPTMARIHALNLQTWRHDDAARGLFDDEELDGLFEALVSLTREVQPAGPIHQDLGELVIQRDPE